MDKYIGKSVMRGIAIGRIYLYKKVDVQVTDRKVADAAAEKERFFAAVFLYMIAIHRHPPHFFA